MGTAVRTPLSQSKTLLHQRTATEDTAQRGGGDSASNPTDLTPTGNWPYSLDSASWLAIEYDARHLQPDSPTWLYGGSTARPAFVVVKMYKYDLQRCPLMASESPTHHQLSPSPDFQQNHHRHNSNNAFHHLRHRRPLRPRCRRPGHLRRGSLVLCPFRPRCKPPNPLRPPVSNPLTTPLLASGLPIRLPTHLQVLLLPGNRFLPPVPRHLRQDRGRSRDCCACYAWCKSSPMSGNIWDKK